MGQSAGDLWIVEDLGCCASGARCCGSGAAGKALFGTLSPSDPSESIAAQENYKAVFESGASATPAQRGTAIKSIELAAQQLQKGGYSLFARKVTDWLAHQ